MLQSAGIITVGDSYVVNAPTTNDNFLKQKSIARYIEQSLKSN